MHSNSDHSFLTCGWPYPHICTEIELDFTPLQALLFPEQVLQVLGLVSGQTRRLVSAAPPLPLVWRLPTQVCCWSDLFLVLCTPQGIEESLLSQDRTNRSASSLDDTSRTQSPVASRSFTRNGQVLTELQAFLACLTCVSLVSHIVLRKIKLLWLYFEAFRAVTSRTSSSHGISTSLKVIA